MTLMARWREELLNGPFNESPYHSLPNVDRNYQRHSAEHNSASAPTLVIST